MSVLHLGCCISAHGFGHAARTAAVIQAVAELTPVHCTVVSQVPPGFFRSCLPCPFTHYPWQTDIGLAVKNSGIVGVGPASRSPAERCQPVRLFSGRAACQPAAEGVNPRHPGREQG